MLLSNYNFIFLKVINFLLKILVLSLLFKVA